MTDMTTFKRRMKPKRLTSKWVFLLSMAGLVFLINHNILNSLWHNDQNKSKPWVTVNSQQFNQDHILKHANHLIVVAGHSVVISGHLSDADRDESDWFLLEYQKGKGLPQSIVAHIREGIHQAAKDPRSLLLFSGGETRGQTGPLNEGTSYFHVADAMNLWGEVSTFGTVAAGSVRSRSMSEEFATDSFQNLLFSICRFYEITGSYPRKITMISFTFKQTRFETMHSKAIRWPSERFQYIGVDPPASTGFDLESAIVGELENAAKPFESDPYGCHTSLLQEKRKMRNPFNRTPPYELSCPDMKHILNWCGPELIAEEIVPW